DSDNLEFVEDFEQPDIEGVPSYGAVAFHPDQTELLDAYNDKLAELKESGKIAEILEDNGFDGERNYPEDEVTAQMVCDEIGRASCSDRVSTLRGARSVGVDEG